MKKIILLLSVQIVNFAFGQVGINTSRTVGVFNVDGAKDNPAVGAFTPAQARNDVIVTNNGRMGIRNINLDPSSVLDVRATDLGVLFPKVSLVSDTDAVTILSPAKGLIVYNINSNAIMQEGFYVNYGIPASPLWKTFAHRYTYRLSNIFDAKATNPVDMIVPGNQTLTIDLGMSITVTVPPFTNAKLVTSYSVPLGLHDSSNNATGAGGYEGVRFMKNGIEFEAGSRKFTIPDQSGGAAARMVSVGNEVSDTINNDTAAPMIITYSLQGYAENLSSTSGVFRFNMSSATPPNFNWGKSYMYVKVFTRPNN